MNNPVSALIRLTDDARVVAIQRALGRDAVLHFVGGMVRDALSGKEISDLDCASRLRPEELRERLERAGIHTIPTGLKHQTIMTVPVAETPGVEITTFRGADMSPAGGVSASESIDTDVLYRDFTINALAFDIGKQQLIDLVGGVSDLANKLIRAVGVPHERFREDPLRVMRMIRFACASDFTIDPETYQASREFVPALSAVSIERIRDELSKILISDRPELGFQMLQELGILKLFLPELELAVGFEQNEYHLHDVFVHTLEVVRRTPPDLLLRMAALLHDIGKPPTLSIEPETGSRHFFKHESVGVDISRELLRRLKYSNEFTENVCVLVATHMRPIEAGPGGLRRLMRDTGELFPVWRILKEADSSACKVDPVELQNRLRQFDEAIEVVKQGPAVSPLKSLAVNGDDLLAAGFEPGPLIGQLLRGLHERVLDEPELNEKEKLLALVPTVQAEIAKQEA